MYVCIDIQRETSTLDLHRPIIWNLLQCCCMDTSLNGLACVEQHSYPVADHQEWGVHWAMLYLQQNASLTLCYEDTVQRWGCSVPRPLLWQAVAIWQMRAFILVIDVDKIWMAEAFLMLLQATVSQKDSSTFKWIKHSFFGMLHQGL